MTTLAHQINSVQTRCIVKGEAQKSPLFWRFSGGFWFSQDRLLSGISTSKPWNLIESRIFTNAPCKSTRLCNAPSVHSGPPELLWKLGCPTENDPPCAMAGYLRKSLWCPKSPETTPNPKFFKGAQSMKCKLWTETVEFSRLKVPNSRFALHGLAPP